MSLQVAAQHLAAHGRNGDSLLVHMTPREVAGLDALARSHYGRGLPTNPHTGLPEASLLGGLLPMIIGIGGSMMGVPPMLTAALVGGGEAMATGSLMKGITSGMGAYGGASIGEGIGAMGDAGSAATAAGGTATSATTPMYDATAGADAAGAGADAAGNGLDGAAGDMGTGYASNAASPGYVNSMDAMSDAAANAGSSATGAASTGYAGDPTAAGYDPGYGTQTAATNATPAMADKMRSGLGAIGQPGSWGKFSAAMGGDKGVMRAGMMAMMPAISESMQPPKMPGANGTGGPALIRPYHYDQHSQRYAADTPYNATDANLHSFYASGGPVRRFGGGGLSDAIQQAVSQGVTNAPSTIPHYTYDQATQRFTNTAPPVAAGPAGGGGPGAGAGMDSAVAAGQTYDLRDPANFLKYLQADPQGSTSAYGYAAGGGIGALHQQGRFLKGPGDGVSDSIPATIEGNQPARLANEEYVVPARVVSEIGNGSSTAGARRLDEMVKRVSQARRKTMGSRSAIAADSGAHRMLPA